MARVYLETSFISACVEQRTDAVSVEQRTASLEWWTKHRAGHECFVSLEVEKEILNPRYPLSQAALKWIEPLPFLERTPQVDHVARAIVVSGILPERMLSDALHLAFASVHRMDWLLTWNQRHLANPLRLERLSFLCYQLRVLPPMVITPEALRGDAK